MTITPTGKEERFKEKKSKHLTFQDTRKNKLNKNKYSKKKAEFKSMKFKIPNQLKKIKEIKICLLEKINKFDRPFIILTEKREDKILLIL